MRKMKMWLSLAGACLLVAGAVACSSSDSDAAAGAGGGTAGTGGGTAGTGGGSSNLDCAGVCGKIAAANCPEEDDAATCTAGCESEMVPVTACASQAAAYGSCISSTATISCDEDGYAVMSGCDAQQTAYMLCAICEPSANDDACDTCTKTSCCTEMKTAYGDPNFDEYFECAFACSDQACVDACESQYASAAALFAAAQACVSSSCETQCQ